MNWYRDTPASPCREMRQREHSEPEKLTETAQVLEVSFSGQEYRGRQALCAGYRGAAPCWDQGARPIGGLRAASPIGSRVKRLAQGELMPCVNSYWVLPDAEIRRFSGFAAAPLREKSTENGGMKIETDTAQRTLRQAWHL